MYVVCKDFDGKLNYPDSKYFKGPYGLEDVLNGAIQPCAGDMLCLCPPIWGACNTDESVCVPAYGLRACAWDYDPVLNEYRLYTSLKADNHIKPYEGSIANPKTWDGGYDACGYLNRPVAKDLDGKLYYPGDKDTVFCGVQCSAVDNPDFTYVGGKLRVNFPAPPTPVRIVAIDDSGTQTTITLSDGTVISGPEVDKDDYVVGYSTTKNLAGENVLTITMKSGATHSVTLPAGAIDTYTTGLSVTGTTLTLTQNNGLAPLTVSLPAGSSSSITDLTNMPNYEAGTIQVNSSDGADTLLDITHENFWPTAWARVGTTNNQGANGDKPPNVSLNGGKSHLTGGFTYNGAGHFVVPKNGTYRVMYRTAVIGNQQILYPNGNRCLVKLMISGTQFSQLIMQDHTGIHSGEELNDFRDHDIALSKGDTVTINVAEESPDHWLDAYDLKLQFINSSMGN